MIRFKILRSHYYDKNIGYNYEKNVRESGEYYINKDIENFCMHNPDIEILDINLLLNNYGLLVVIKYTEKTK